MLLHRPHDHKAWWDEGNACDVCKKIIDGWAAGEFRAGHGITYCLFDDGKCRVSGQGPDQHKQDDHGALSCYKGFGIHFTREKS